MFMYIVVVDHPYYPYCEYFNNIDDAKKFLEKNFEENNNENGTHELKVTLAEIVETKEGKSNY